MCTWWGSDELTRVAVHVSLADSEVRDYLTCINADNLKPLRRAERERQVYAQTKYLGIYGLCLRIAGLADAKISRLDSSLVPNPTSLKKESVERCNSEVTWWSKGWYRAGHRCAAILSGPPSQFMSLTFDCYRGRLSTRLSAIPMAVHRWPRQCLYAHRPVKPRLPTHPHHLRNTPSSSPLHHVSPNPLDLLIPQLPVNFQ